MKPANVFTIRSDSNFLETLFDALFSGTIINGFSCDKEQLLRDPFHLADITLYLPTRRAVRGAETVLLDRVQSLTGSAAAVLPKIRALGDADEADLLLSEIPSDTPVLDVALLPGVSELERHLVLTQWVLSWSQALLRDVSSIDAQEAVLIPAGPADAARLAADLAKLIDEAHNHETDWAQLKNLVPDDFARYWQLSLSFLEIVTEQWPTYLRETGRMDAMARRDTILRAKAQFLKDNAPQGPVIAAGSTGSVPATASLLASIASLPRGAVVLPGLDQELDDDVWEAIGQQHEVDPAVLGHPQAVLKQTLSRLLVTRDEPWALGADCTARLRLLNEALRPAVATDGWSDLAKSTNGLSLPEATNGLTLIEASTPQEEALAIAIALRKALEIAADANIALVTPDRGLAERVCSELQRFGISADDSAGAPLFETPAGQLARLIADVVSGGAHPISVLALLKHPMCGLGQARAKIRSETRALERASLRGPTLSPGLTVLERHTSEIADRLRENGSATDRGMRLSRSQVGLKAGDWLAAAALATCLRKTLEPFEALHLEPQRAQPLSELVGMHLDAIQGVCSGDDTAPLFADSEDGKTLVAALTEIRELAERFPHWEIPASSYKDFLSVMIGQRPVRRPQQREGSHPGVQILGVLEARLLSFDCTVLAGLNEGSWPAETRLDAFLSRQMRARLSLPPPERALGLSAHDFVQLASGKNVILSRALMQDGAPTQPSRWLQRLSALIGQSTSATLRSRGDCFLEFARSLDRPEQPAGNPAIRPFPRPHSDLRPSRLSVTEITTLIRDPYTIFARHILKLNRFEKLGEIPDFANRGIIIHEILHRFIAEWHKEFDTVDARDQLLQLADQCFEPLKDFPDLFATWRARFDRIADWFLRYEANRDTLHPKRHVELFGTIDLNMPKFRLTGRADRIDVFPDGTAEIIDYKTGQPPSAKQVGALLEPQLPLETVILAAGGFEGLGPTDARDLSYVQLTGGQVAGRSRLVVGGIEDVRSLRTDALAKLKQLVAHYADTNTAYISQLQPVTTQYEGDYDHLARVPEWRSVEHEGSS